MVAVSSLFTPNLVQCPTNLLKIPKSSCSIPALASFQSSRPLDSCSFACRPRMRTMRILAVSTDAPPSARRLYVGNIPRTVTNEQLTEIFQEHGAVEKAEVMYDKYSGRSRRFAFVTMSTVEDANAAIEKLNETEIGGRKIQVNITEKPFATIDLSILQDDESKFIDSPYKVYVGNLAKTVTTELLTKFFSEKGKVLSAKVSRVPGTSKSSGFGFVSFSAEEDVEAAISSRNNVLLEGQRIRVNKA